MKILMGENLVYDAPVQVGSHHYARLFSKEHEVLWISLPWNVFLLLKYGFKGDRYVQWNKGKVIEKENLKIWCPFTFMPYRDNFLFRSQKNISRSLKYTVPNLKKVIKKEGFQTCDILWITDPRMMYLTKITNYKVLVYRCVDDLSRFTGIPNNIRITEEKLVKKADIVFATANTLKERLEGYGGKIIGLPNAVDYEYFANYQTEGKESKIDNLKNVILYVGTIGEWFDCEFVKYCALHRPNYNFVVIGPERTDTSSMKGISNIHMIGTIKYEEVPLYMKRSDIGIIPFKTNELVNAVNPLKLYEYFACNLPVVSTAAYEMKKLNSPALLYTSYDEAISYFDNLLNSKEPFDYSLYARKNSWQERNKYIWETIQGYINEKEEKQ